MMFRSIIMVFVLLLPGALAADVIRMAVTTSFHNSGLSDVLLPIIKKDTDVEIQLLVVGTGQALALGRRGDVDAVLVHAKAAEEAFVADGHAPYRREIMYNDFVIVGPNSDPAGVRAATDVSEALSKIADAKALFASRADDSGTHKAELALWTSPPKGAWYLETGSGMGATLNTAVARSAYVLADRASWLNFGNAPEDMSIVFEGDPRLRNQYAFLPIIDGLRTDAVARVEAWLVGRTGQAAIANYRLSDQQVFFPNAR